MSHAEYTQQKYRLDRPGFDFELRIVVGSEDSVAIQMHVSEREKKDFRLVGTLALKRDEAQVLYQLLRSGCVASEPRCHVELVGE